MSTPAAIRLRPGAAEAWARLTVTVADLAETGVIVPCRADPEPFASDNRAIREQAAESCAGCPVLDLCDRYAETQQESALVWGGRDREPPVRQWRKKGAS